MDGLIGGTIIDTTWITRDVARAVVSQKIDDERISPDEADQLFSSMRDAGRYQVHVRFSTLRGGPEFNENGMFLQREGQRDVFSRGRFADAIVFDTGIRVTVEDSQHVVSFPKVTEAGSPLVTSLDDRLEISLKTQYKKPSVTSYRVKDLVDALTDL